MDAQEGDLTVPNHDQLTDEEIWELEPEPEAPDQDPFIGGIQSRASDEIFQPFDPSQIRVETKPMVISLILERIKNTEIDLNPGFQRKGGIWSDKAKSRLIESLLIRIPLPAFYMDGTDESRWLVVDGLQRLSALTEFVLQGRFKLRGLEFLSDYEGYTFTKLPRKLQRRILETQVIVFLIQEHTPAEVKFNIFKRINTGGLPLSTQEIRHALNQGPATELLHTLATDSTFLDATQNGIPDRRMGDRECVLRFLAFTITPPQSYKLYDLDTFLNEAMADINKMARPALHEVSERFRRSMRINEELWGNYAFRKRKLDSSRRGPINRALFEIWSVTMNRLDDDDVSRLQERRELLNTNMSRALEDIQFDAAITFGTGDSRKVQYRFGKAQAIVAETLK